MWTPRPPPISQTTRAVGPEETILYIFTAWKAECGRKSSRQKQMSISGRVASESDSALWFTWFLVTCRGHTATDRLSDIRVQVLRSLLALRRGWGLFPQKRRFFMWRRYASPVGYTSRGPDKPKVFFSFNVYPKYTVPHPSIPAENPNPPTTYQIKSLLETQQQKTLVQIGQYRHKDAQMLNLSPLRGS